VQVSMIAQMLDYVEAFDHVHSFFLWAELLLESD
jgi:hypothetical protein